MTAGPERYARQAVLKEIGAEGQAKLCQSAVLVVGCGALGCNQAQLLARAGVGRLRIVDRDFVELANLQRQVLFDEDDAAAALPKAEAARRRLARINSDVQVEAVVADVAPRNVEALVRGVDLVLDATDNFETRYLVNDACVKLGTPWVYGGAIGVAGTLMTVRPGVGPCLRCLFADAPAPGTLPGCDLVGVLNTAPEVVAALQVTEALRLLVGDAPATCHLTAVDLWDPRFQRVAMKRDPDCVCCVRHQYDFLGATETSTATSLCGRNAVQVTPARSSVLALDVLARQLEALGKVTSNGLLLCFQVGEHELVIFPDARVIVRGTQDPAVARSLYARYIGA
jgi:adenylyltransferase/sulfurtransferase